MAILRQGVKRFQGKESAHNHNSGSGAVAVLNAFDGVNARGPIGHVEGPPRLTKSFGYRLAGADPSKSISHVHHDGGFMVEATPDDVHDVFGW